MASIQHGSWRITSQHIWNSIGSKPEYFALHLDLFKYKQISTFLHYVLKCVLEGNGVCVCVSHHKYNAFSNYLPLFLSLSPNINDVKWMSWCVLCVKELSLCAPHLKIDVDSTQKMMLMTNICFHNLLCIIADKL